MSLLVRRLDVILSKLCPKIRNKIRFDLCDTDVSDFEMNDNFH